jgi:hypothetical protein
MPNRTLALVIKALLVASVAAYATADVPESAAQQKKKKARAGPTAGNEQAPPKPKSPKLAPTAPSSGRGTN